MYTFGFHILTNQVSSGLLDFHTHCWFLEIPVYLSMSHALVHLSSHKTIAMFNQIWAHQDSQWQLTYWKLLDLDHFYNVCTCIYIKSNVLCPAFRGLWVQWYEESWWLPCSNLVSFSMLESECDQWQASLTWEKSACLAEVSVMDRLCGNFQNS